MENPKCKICRRAGEKVFLKGDKCFSVKCPVTRRPFPPGPKSKKRKRGVSEYGKELREKQKMRFWYGLGEKQFKTYVKDILSKRGKEDNELSLIKKLEMRLDNVIFKLGFALSRVQARQMVTHGHFKINGKKVSYPSCQIKKGDVITINPASLKKNAFQNLKLKIKNYTAPSWLDLKKDDFEGKVIADPTLEEAAPPAEISAILEYYSR
jgi:small subunit ribosomal protein S4